MMRLKELKLIFAGLVIFSSCSTLIDIPAVYHAEITPPGNPSRIVFVNNFDYTNNDIVPDIHRRIYNRAVKSFIKGLSLELPAGDSVAMVTGDTLMKVTPAGMLTTMLPGDMVNWYCNRYDAGMLVSLDSINIGYSTRADYLESVGLVNLYSRDFYLYGEFFLSVYDSSGSLVTRSSVDREIKFSWRLGVTSDVAFDPSLASEARKIDRVAVPCGQEFALKFRNVQQIEQRLVYTNAQLVNSVGLMKEGRWNDALRDLERITSTAQGTLLDHALVNLDVAREGTFLGDTLIKRETDR